MEEKEVGLVVTYTHNNIQLGTIFYKDESYKETSLEEVSNVIADIMLQDNITNLKDCNKIIITTYKDYKNNFNNYIEKVKSLNNFKFAHIFEQVMNYYNN